MLSSYTQKTDVGTDKEGQAHDRLLTAVLCDPPETDTYSLLDRPRRSELLYRSTIMALDDPLARLLEVEHPLLLLAVGFEA